MPMSKREINAVVRRVCNSEFKCPVYEAMSRFAGDRVIVLCDCHGPKKLNKCPLRDALKLAAEEERKEAKRMRK